jgi:3-hydroxybutyryl-CoA dehydrogenase
MSQDAALDRLVVMGPLRVSDLVGLDVRLDIASHLHRTVGGTRFEPPAVLMQKMAAGEPGKKSGKGFYVWPPTSS